MKEYLDFIRELADLIEEIGFEPALERVEESTEHEAHYEWWPYLEEGVSVNAMPSFEQGITYRIKPATTQHPGGEMPQHISSEVFASLSQNYYLQTPFNVSVTKRTLVELYGEENAHKMAFHEAAKARAAEKVMRGF